MIGRKVNLKVTRVLTDLGYYVEYEMDDPAFTQDLKDFFGGFSIIRIVLPGEPRYVTAYDVSIYINESGAVYRVKRRDKLPET